MIVIVDRVVVIVAVVAVGCGPSVGVGMQDGDGSGGGDTTSGSASADAASSGGGPDSSGPSPAVCGDGIVDASEACDDGNLDDGDGCDSQCRVPGTQLWETFLPPLSSCPRLAALDDGGIAVVGNEYFEPTPAAIPHLLVVDSDGGVRWSFQGGHWATDTIRDLVADADGFVVAGQGGELPDLFLGWMQHWSADGTMDAEVIFDADEPGDLIDELERRDAMSYWISASDGGLDPRTLRFRTFDEPPISSTAIDSDGSGLLLARAPEDGVYVAASAEPSTLSRFDRDGVALWTIEYPATFEFPSSPRAIASMGDGHAIVTGSDQGRPDSQWIERYDADGIAVWRTTVEVSAEPSDDVPEHVAVDLSDNSFVFGETWTEAGGDGFLVKYDGDGVELWQVAWSAEGAANVKACDVVTTAAGFVVVTGAEYLEGETRESYWLRAYTP